VFVRDGFALKGFYDYATFSESYYLWERPPLRVMIKDNRTDVEYLIYVIHTSPDDVPNEMSNLFDLTSSYGAEELYENKTVIFLGDYNYGCTYADSNETIFPKTNWTWVIPDTADTTVAPTTFCPYDRIFIKEPHALINNTIIDDSITKDLSDHKIVGVWLNEN
jgi:endonuclease/exonuclease/phosphatase family metal-dependent hydrolase